MGAPTGTTVLKPIKPWRGYPSVNAVHGIRCHINQDVTKYVSAGLVPANTAATGQFSLTANGAAVHIGTIPAGAIILPLTKHVIVGFLPMTTAVIDVGTTGTPGGLLLASDVAAVGFTASISTGTLIGYTAVQLELYIKLTITGSTPTVGEVDVLVPFYIQKD
jgi:hypothetical protein